MAVLTFVVLGWVSAPYGRHLRAGWGPVVPHRVAWVVMESPAVVAFVGIFGLGQHSADSTPLVLLALWQLHYLHRTLVYPFRTKSSHPWPVLLVTMALTFQLWNSYLNARWLSEFGEYPASWLLDPRFIVGTALFGAGLALNLHSDGILRRLRGSGESGYLVPHGGGFELVSCPNYSGEILEWCGWALATWSPAGLAFALYTIANLGPRAVSHHRWYRREFPDYPPHRRALIPFLL
ncbi:MAG: 3-oxo-5-alpha-steroid 4-dehydrogenase [Polyangiaceae bacterium]|nr:3-oxo-5-alpha-steroid 4-dehydrogenase [Polyangiaceae bacterium]